MKIIENIFEHLQEYEVRRVAESEYNEVYKLQLTNPDYFSCMQDHEVALEECIEGTESLPPDTDRGQKYYLGFYNESRLVAILDLIIGYPDSHTAWIGLLMVSGSLRGRGIGRRVCSALSDSLKKSGYKLIQLAVIESNDKALEFWTAMGFEEVRRSKTIDDGKPGIDVIVMEQALI